MHACMHSEVYGFIIVIVALICKFGMNNLDNMHLNRHVLEEVTGPR